MAQVLSFGASNFFEMRIKNSLLVGLIILLSSASSVFATGEPSNYFNIFIPPNNDAVHRDVCLVVTAIFDSTSFVITDDAMDGDTDDSVSGVLMAGQSYILYIRDNGINDDAASASGGTLKRDGDYFIITSSKNVYASQSTNSDWQHDWVPGISQSSLSQKFILYSTKTTSSPREFNAFAYEDSTYVTLRRISLTPTTISGYTNVDYENGTAVFQRMIHRGQDLIHFFPDARNILADGHTYVIESSKPVTIQYGALFGNERDGGGYVPMNTGSSSGSLAYFAVPYQSTGEQEIRVVSWDAGNNVKLYRFSGGNWVLMKDWSMGQRTFQEWVGKNNGNVSYPTVFKIECTPGKRISVFEGNWFETGSPGTSDMATMMSSENGTTSGNYFIAYMAPPGNENNVFNPFTNALFGGQFTHLYIFAQDAATVSVKDAYTNGVDFNRSYTIAAGRYVDCALSLSEWKSIYNGTGTTAGGAERPYLIVTSDQPVSVMNTNFNDNWMMYFGSSQFQSFGQTTTSSSSTITPGQTHTVTSDIKIEGNSEITNVTANVIVEGGLKVISSTFQDVTNTTNYPGEITSTESNVTVTFDSLPNLNPVNDYKIVTNLTGNVMDSNGDPIPNNSVSAVTTVINGTSNNHNLQSTSLESVALNSYNTSNLIYDFAENTGLEAVLTDSWTCSAIDYDNDGDDDLFFTDNTSTQPNKLFRNNGNLTFSDANTSGLSSDLAKSTTSSWADVDNDGDVDVLVANNTQKPNCFYINKGNGTFTKDTTPGFANEIGYYHHASWVDVDNDGQVELFLGNYWPTRLNELWKKDTNGEWELWLGNLLSQIAGVGTGATWADFDNDGYQDLLVLNNAVGGYNRCFHNLGNGQFESIENEITTHGGYSVGSAWGDIDGDLDLDLFVCNASNKDNELYINQGNGNFQLISNVPVTTDKGHSHGASFADVDNDCDLDLFVSNDQGVKFLYLNNGQGSFTKKSDEWPTSNFGKGYGTSFSDLDSDGDLDLVSATHGNQRNYIFSANNNANKWLNVRLVGTNSNKSAIGARIKVKSGGKWQCSEVNSQNGFGGQNSYRQHFGLCDASVIDSLVVTWPSGTKQTMINLNPNQNMVITETNSSEVHLRAFYDENGNCLQDTEEISLSNVEVSINSDTWICTTDTQGLAKIYLTPGNYSATVLNETMADGCSASYDFTVTTIGEVLQIPAFAIIPKCLYPDLEVHAFVPVLRRGFPVQYTIDTSNLGIEKGTEIQVIAELPSALTVTNSEPVWTSKTSNGNVQIITWNSSDLAYNETTFITLDFTVPLSYSIGDQVISNFSISNSGNDCDPGNNAFTDEQFIVGSMDPNDLLASPVGFADQHFIESNQPITYRVRFQNVGNYPAEFARIVDVLPTELDASSIRDITASHSFRTIREGNKLEFFFDQIHLADSTSNEPESHGYIQFTAAFKQGTTAGTYIENTASIQFDYNEYIITNTVWHTVTASTKVSDPYILSIFPNPANDRAIIRTTHDSSDHIRFTKLSIFSIEGALLLEENTNGNVAEVDTKSLPEGMHFVVALDEDGKLYKGKMMVIH